MPENLNYHFEWDEIKYNTQLRDPVNKKIAGIIKSRLENNGAFSICEYGVEFLAYYHRGIVRFEIQCGDALKTNQHNGEDNEYHIEKLTDAILTLKIANISFNFWLEMAETFVDDSGEIAENMFIGRGRQLEEDQR